MRKTRVRQGMSEGMPNEVRGCGIAGKVALVARLTPSPLWVPMPGFDVKFGVLTIGHGLPAGGQNLLENRIREKLVGRGSRNAIDASTQRFRGTKRIGRVFRSDIYVDGLRKRRRHD